MAIASANSGLSLIASRQDWAASFHFSRPRWAVERAYQERAVGSIPTASLNASSDSANLPSSRRAVPSSWYRLADGSSRIACRYAAAAPR